MDAWRSCTKLAGALALAGLALRATPPQADASALRGIALATLSLELLLAAAALGIAGVSRVPPRTSLGLLPPRGGALRVCAAAAGTIGLSAALDGLLARSQLRDASVLARVDTLLAASALPDLGFALAGLVLAPALAEELLCRGLVQRELARRAPPAAAVLGAALFFGALHFEWIQGGAAALLGVYLGVVAWRFGSTGPAIACHLANNAVAVLSAFSALPLDSSRTPVLLGGLAVAAAGIALLPHAPAAAAPAAATADPGGAAPEVSPLQSEARSDDS